jgi:tetratricopeptide (TPR) repeat protein
MYDRYLRLPAGEKHQEYAFHLGELYEQQRLTSQAVERYKTNIGAYPDDARNYERLAELYMATGKTEEALPILEKVSGLQKGRDDAKVDQMLVRARESTARSHFMAEKWPQARSAYEQLLELDRNNGDAHAKLATIHIRMGNTDAAEKHLREAQRLGRGTAQAWLELGKLYAVKEHVDKGIEALEQCIALEPHREDVLRELARLQEEKGYLEKAAATHLKLYERQPGKNVSNLTAAGVLNEKAGNTDEARRIYELFLYHGYVDAEVNVRLARIESATGRHEKTVELLEGLEGSWAAEEEVLMMLAEAHVALDQHAKAQPYVVRVVARNPRQKRALELAARVSEKIGDRHQAIKIYEKYLALPKTDRHPDMAFRLGQLYLETGDTTKAKERFNRNIASYSKDARNYENLAKIHMLAGKPAAAGVLVEKALRLPDVSADARKMMAQVQAARNNRAGAIKYYEHYLKEQPTDSVALMELGRLYRERGDYDDAVEPLVTASVLMPQRRQVHYLLGDTYVRLEKHKKSLEPLLRSRKLDSRHVPTLRGLADSYRALADTAALVEVLHTLTALEPDEYDVQYEYGVLLVRGNKANEAMPHLEKAYAIKPTTDAGMALGEACFALGKYEEVLTHLETVLVRRPKDSRVLELAAIANEKTGKLKPASLLYARYLKLPETDRHPEYAYRLGRLYEQRDMISIAMRQYQKNIDAYSRDVRNYERLARLHIGKRNFDEARPLLQKAHRLPEAPRYLSLLLAQTLEAQGELGNAVKQYQRYLKQAPDDTTALISLGALLFAREDYKRAIQPLEAAVRRTEKNVECRYMLGASYARQKKYRKAVGPLRDAHEIAPEDQRPLRALAECFRWLKDERDLIAVLEKVTVLDSTDYAARAELGELFLRRGEDKKAVPVLEAALKLKPSDVESHLTLAEIHNTRGNDSLQYRHLSLALKQAPSSAKVNKRLGIYHFGRNAMQKAARYLSRSVKYESKDAESRYLYGKALLSLGQTKSAYSQLSRAVQYDQKNARYHLERAKAAHSLRHKRNAMKAARHAVRYAPKNGDALYWMGYLHLEYGAPDSAKPYLKRAAREKKECPLCYEFLGDISARENDYREAAKHYDRALKEDEENQELAIKLGRALYNDGKYRKALKEFERLFTHKPKNNEALYWMIRSAITDNRLSLAEKIVSIHRKSNRSAWMQLAVGELDEAKGNHSSAYAGFKSAARGLSKSGPAQAAMGRGSLRKRHFKSATIYFTRALEQEPYTVEYVLGLGQAYEGRGKLGPAQVHYRQAIEMEPKNARAKFLLSGVEWERKKRTQSIKTLREAIKLDSRVGEYHLELGHRYRLMSRHKKAIDAYEKAARHGEGEMERKSYKLIGDIYYLKLKDLDKARAFYERFMKAGGKSATVAGRLKKL